MMKRRAILAFAALGLIWRSNFIFMKWATALILIGLVANTCIESTGRFAMELGYHVTLVKDGTAAFSQEMTHAAHELNGPTFAHAILSTTELISALGPTSSPGSM